MEFTYNLRSKTAFLRSILFIYLPTLSNTQGCDSKPVAKILNHAKSDNFYLASFEDHIGQTRGKLNKSCSGGKKLRKGSYRLP